MIPTTGAVAVSTIQTELGLGAGSKTNFSDASVRGLALKPTGPVNMSDVRGKRKMLQCNVTSADGGGPIGFNTGSGTYGGPTRFGNISPYLPMFDPSTQLHTLIYKPDTKQFMLALMSDGGLFKALFSSLVVGGQVFLSANATYQATPYNAAWYWDNVAVNPLVVTTVQPVMFCK